MSRPSCAASAAAADGCHREPMPKAHPERADAPARPRFAELAEEPAYTPLPRDYASDFRFRCARLGSSRRRGAAQPAAAALFPNAEEEPERDLDVPTFMRRMQF